jgi:DNA polymerase-3 subunit alpha
MKRPFVHLHVHTEYSMLESTLRINQLVQKATEYEMPALAITDRGNMFAGVRFINACRKAKIKPILGCELNVCVGSRLEKTKKKLPKSEKDSYHLTVLARNQQGYQNLSKIVSTGYMDGFYYRPRVDKEVLEKHSEGLIVTSSDMVGEIPWLIRHGKKKEAMEAAVYLRDLFGKDHFFIELENQFQDYQADLMADMFQMAKDLGVRVVAGNDVHYLNHEDASTHDILLCIGSNHQVKTENRWRMPTDQFYFKSPDEMYVAMQGYEEACENTMLIAEMIDFEIKEEYQLPKFDIPEHHTEDSYLKAVVLEGFEERRRKILDPMKEKGSLRKEWDEYYKRIDIECAVIEEMGFPGYFLIVWDFIRKAKEMGVPVGPGRGSAAGSIVAYALEITDIDPLQYDLLFERFLNKERVTMPDVDIDFCQDRRIEVIDYVTEKYGRENVCQIVTYGTMKARMVIKDVGRALGFQPTETNRIAKLVPEDLGITLPKALEQSSDLKEEYDRDERIRELLDISIKLEGLCRNTGVHAAGVIIAPGDVTDWAPLYKDSKKGTISVQYAKDEAEQIGLLKMDFLGLKTLTVISNSLENIKETTGQELDLNDINDFNDPKTYDLFKRGETDGVFQFESDGMKNILIRLGPKRFEDFIALNALYRPGPLGSGMVDTFIEGAHGAKVDYELDILEDILEETYGVILYQEQVMKIAQVVGGFSLAGADLLRRAMGKKKADVMAQKKLEFLEGAKERGYPEKPCGELFDKMAEFAKYGFNKSHSAAYSLVAYQTAYLKANYKKEFMAALLTLDKDNTEKVVNYVDKCRSQYQIPVLPPDVRFSKEKFVVEGDSIRFALSGIKGLGDSALASIMKTKEEVGIHSFEDFFSKVDLRKINKKVVEVLVKSGAFDFTEKPRKAMLEAIEDMLNWGHKQQKEASGGQDNLFGDEENACWVKIGNEEWEPKEKLDFEKETLGFYLSGHPLEEYRRLLRKHATHYTSDLEDINDGTEILIGGMLNSVRKIVTQKGDDMAFLALEDFHGMVDCVVFPRTFEEKKHMLEADKMIVIKGKVESRNDRPNVIVQDLFELSDWESKRIKSCVVQFNPDKIKEESLDQLAAHFRAHPGDCQVYFDLRMRGNVKTVIKAGSLTVEPGREVTKIMRTNPEFRVMLRY